MGANTFGVKAKGATAEKAFRDAVRQACHDHGHSGYTGTLAEKDSFTLIPVPEGADPLEFAEQLIDTSDPRIDDKWGPAGCLQLGKDEFYFFGWASS